MAAIGRKEFEASFQERNPRDCALFLFDKIAAGEGQPILDHLRERGIKLPGTDISDATGFLYVSDPASIAPNLASWVRGCRVAHDLGVLYVFASRQYQAAYDQTTEELSAAHDLTSSDLESGILHALARQDLAIKVGATLLHPLSTEFPK